MSSILKHHSTLGTPKPAKGRKTRREGMRFTAIRVDFDHSVITECRKELDFVKESAAQ
jgi:hypothetical protein